MALIKEISVAIKWLVFSDTVLLTLDMKKVEPPSHRLMYWFVFLAHCSSLWKSMFAFGLPLRGAITTGEYLVEKTCFAGRPIVEAYKLANDINCAGVVIADSAIELFKPDIIEAETSEFLHFDYSFPSVTGAFAERAALNVMFSVLEDQKKWAGDIRQLVHESFWAHNKSNGPGVPEKIENTEGLLRFLKMKWPHGFVDLN
jgi:hypothetical protein